EHGFDDGAGLFVQGNFTSSAGRRAVQELLGRRRDLTGIVVDSDEMAFGVLAELRARGVTVPGDVSVISVDGVEVGELLGLTTMAQDAFSQGVAGARMILDLIAGNSPAPDVIFSPHLIARSSTGPVPLRASTALPGERPRPQSACSRRPRPRAGRNTVVGSLRRSFDSPTCKRLHRWQGLAAPQRSRADASTPGSPTLTTTYEREQLVSNS